LLHKSQKKHYVVYYTNADWSPLPEVVANAKDSLHIPADDIDRFLKVYSPPTATQLDEALQWTRDREELVVACHAGVSRSSATAYVIASRNMGPKEALKKVLDPYSHQPNRLIVYMGSKLLKQDEIWDHFIDWSKEHHGIDPSKRGSWPNEEVKSQIYWP
jgi:predicted protein tyrosine phosphatase